jgi:peroxiredoxin Q/BCP
VGQPAPDIVGRDVEGRDVRLSAQPGPVVVYFYPKDGTPGCTKEACAFRDVWGQYQQAHVAVIGVSTNSAEQHAKFLRDEKLPFALAADEAGTIASAYGVGKGAFGYERVTFLVGDDHKIARFWPNVDPGVHATEVLAAARAAK